MTSDLKAAAELILNDEEFEDGELTVECHIAARMLACHYLATQQPDGGELERLRQSVAQEHDEICQILGKALGYPLLADDQGNFPGATEADGVCYGDHVAVTLAMEAARRLEQQEQPALDAAITEEWLREIGFYVGTTGQFVMREASGLSLILRHRSNRIVAYIDSGMSSVELPSITTQRQLLSLLDALGVPVKDAEVRNG